MILQAKNRTEFKKKSRLNLDLIPAICYGHNKKNIPIYVNSAEFSQIFSKVGKSEVLDLSIEDKKQKVLIKQLNYHPVNQNVLHIDFYLVNVMEDVEVVVPLVLKGESPAVKNLGGILIEVLHSVSIKCLPKFLPKEIEVDISTLNEIGSVFKIADLNLGSNIEIKEDSSEIIVSISKQEEVAEEDNNQPEPAPDKEKGN